MYTEITIVPTLTPMGDVEITENEEVVFETEASGKPTPDVEWFLGLEKLTQSHRVSIDKLRRTHTLTMRKCLLRETGSVIAKATNKAGSCTEEASLVVKGLSSYTCMQHFTCILLHSCCVLIRLVTVLLLYQSELLMA